MRSGGSSKVISRPLASITVTGNRAWIGVGIGAGVGFRPAAPVAGVASGAVVGAACGVAAGSAGAAEAFRVDPGQSAQKVDDTDTVPQLQAQNA